MTKKKAASITMQGTPAAQGYWMPAEWEWHEATWLGWPHEKTDWPGKFAPIPWVYAEIVRHLTADENVYLLVQNRAEEAQARDVLVKSGVKLDKVVFFRVPTDRGWMRDSGPICVKNAAGEVAFTHWAFNAWAKYSNYKKDAAAVPKVNERLQKKVWQPAHRGRRVVLEGGSIDVNGRGTLLTTEECLLSAVQARNPGVPREELEQILRDYLGGSHVIWLKRGIAGDDTHGHVDDLTRFVNETTVVTAVEEDRADINYAPLQENLLHLYAARDQEGRRLRVEKLPMPAPIYFDGQRLPASYANFYIANRVVIVPTFNDPNDRVALNTLAKLFPDRQVVGIHCRDLVLGLGTLHCLTQQQPAAK